MFQNHEKYHGMYYFFGLALTVREQDRGLVAAMAGVPEGYEIRLEPVGEHTFRMHGGPLDQASVHFELGPDGRAHSLQAGGFELKRIDPSELESLEVTERLMEPGYQWSPEKDAAFAGLLGENQGLSDGREIGYSLPYPKHEFVQYLMLQDIYIFHGSGNAGIEQFKPVRTSYELYDREGRGNLQAVYGTHDGLWAMFFAIVDRERLRGSIRNGVMYFHNFKGDPLAVYNFSINREQLSERPFRKGVLYLLPRKTFVRLKLGGEALANEWASELPVRPVARLPVEPEDFPFLERIGGHDDGPLVRMQAMTDKFLQQVQETAESGESSMVLTFQPDFDASQDMPDYIELLAELMPGMGLTYDTGPPARLTITDIPPAYRQVLETRLSAQDKGA